MVLREILLLQLHRKETLAVMVLGFRAIQPEAAVVHLLLVEMRLLVPPEQADRAVRVLHQQFPVHL